MPSSIEDKIKRFLNQGGPQAYALRTGLLGALVVAGLWLISGFFIVSPAEEAVITQLGRYKTTDHPGPHWIPWPIQHHYTVNVQQISTFPYQAEMLTQDENIVEVSMSVQYVIDNPQDFVLQVRDPEVSLQHAAQSALRHVVGGTTMDLALTEGRAAIAFDVRDRLQQYLDDYTTGIRVSTINIDESKPPAQVQGAFDDVIKAREDEERVKNEAQSYANGIVPEARGRAQRMMEESNAYRDQVIARAQGEAQRFEQLLAEYEKAPDVTRERLYIDTVQTVFANTNKVMVDVDGGNNVLYLPLDKMVPNAGQPRSTASRAGVSERDMREIADQVTEQLRRDLDAAAARRGGR